MGKQQRHHMQEADHLGRGASFFVLVALLVSLLLSCGYQQQTASSSKSTALRSKSTSTTIVTVLPTPSTKPISAAVSSGHSTLPVIAKGVAYVGTGDNAFYALQASDGKLLWRIKIDGAVVDFLVATDGLTSVSTYACHSRPPHLYPFRPLDSAVHTPTGPARCERWNGLHRCMGRRALCTAGKQWKTALAERSLWRPTRYASSQRRALRPHAERGVRGARP